MSWSGKRRPPLGPIRLPASAFEEIEPHICDDGTVLKRFYLRGFRELGVLTQQRMDKLIKCEVTKVEPMKIPTGSIFYLDYKYGKDDKSFGGQ